MDPPTHGLLGAVIGQAFFGRTLGRRALVWGAVGAMLPDIDVVMSSTGPMGDWLYHRGVTHALWVPPVAGALLGTAVARAHGVDRAEPVAAWRWLLGITILSHPLLDACTTWGTVLFAPFWNRRFAVEAVAIVDPIFSGLLVLALVVGLVRGAASRAARIAAGTALALVLSYLGYGLHLSQAAEAQARTQLAQEGFPAESVRAYHAPLQPFLHRMVARGGGEIRVGWLSLWSPRPIVWSEFRPASGPLVDEARRTREGQIFEWFTLGQNAARVEPTADGAVVDIDDLRFGFPSAPDRGLWGIRLRFDAEGRMVPPVERVDMPIPESAGALARRIWRETFGG